MKYFIAVLISGFAFHCFGGVQQPREEQPQEEQRQEGKAVIPESYIALMRSNVQSKKTAILEQNLALSEDEAKNFWPLQRSFENDLSKLDDERIEVIREYAKTWEHLSDGTAKTLGKRLLDYRKKRVELAQKYFERMSKELSPTVAAKFFQIELQLEDLLDIEMSSSIPLIR